jgi:hypothetical protein
MENKGAPDNTLTTVLVGVALLALTQPVSDWYEGKPLPHTRTVILVAIAALLFLLAVYPYAVEVPKPMISAVRASLAPVAHNPWTWFAIFVLFWGSLTAGPLIDYYAQRVAFHTVVRPNVLSADERLQYQHRIDHLGDTIVGADGVERNQEQQISDLTSKLDTLQKRTNTAVDDIEKRDWIQEAVHAVGEIETAQREQGEAHAILQTYQREHPRAPFDTLGGNAAAIDGKLVAMKAYPGELEKELKAKLETLRIHQ